MNITQAIIKEVSGFYNKKVKFNMLKPVDENTKSFKISEEIINHSKYITAIRCIEHESYIEVIKINIFDCENSIYKKEKK